MRWQVVIWWLSAALVPGLAIASCELQVSGPVKATRDGQIIENLDIESSAGPGISVVGYRDVIIRNVRIRHAFGPGIKLVRAGNTKLDSVEVVNVTGSAGIGSAGYSNVVCESSNAVAVRNVKVLHGSSGFYFRDCPFANLTYVEGENFRGPFPRGQFVQLYRSGNSTLSDFYTKMDPAISWGEDNVSVINSANVIIRRGLIDGNSSPTGVGVMIEHRVEGVEDGLVEDVDALHMGNGCFATFSGKRVSFINTRCRDNICSDQGRGVPKSGGVGWFALRKALNVKILNSKYFALCGSVVYPKRKFEVVDLKKSDFLPRDIERKGMCWE